MESGAAKDFPGAQRGAPVIRQSPVPQIPRKVRRLIRVPAFPRDGRSARLSGIGSLIDSLPLREKKTLLPETVSSTI
jgi:hypothetical protein